MNLQENIERIKSMMGIIKEETSIFPFTVSGSFKGDNGDRSHAFQSTGGVVVGGMQTEVNKTLKQAYAAGYNPSITKITVTFIGGYGTKMWPQTQAVQKMYDDVLDDIWETVWDYTGISLELYSKKVKDCGKENIYLR